MPAFRGGEPPLTPAAKAAQQQATQQAAAQAAAQKQAMMQKYAGTAVSDINSGNYAGAWNAALQTSPLYNTNYNSATTDPLLQAMESGQGLQQLDPSKKWSPQDIQNYYAAMEANPVYQGKTTDNTINGVTGAESFGKNPYGNWGSAAGITSGKDATANEGAAGDSSAPDVERFAGAKPTTSFLSKYGGDIVSVVGDVAGSFVGDPMAGNQIMMAYDAATGNWKGAALNGVTMAVPGLGGALSSATGGALGAAASDAIVGAGAGALESGISGGNPLIGALGGAASGYVQGSGVNNAVGQSINAATGLPVSIGAGLSGAGIGAGIGGAIGAISGGSAGNGAITGAVRGGLNAGVSSATGSPAWGSAAGTIGAGLAGKYLTSPTTPSAPAAPAAPPVAQPAAKATVQPVSTQQAAPAPTPAPAGTGSNIGSYSGFNSTGLGYQPRQQVNPNITNYNTYGQGPEAQFYQPTPGTT
jgi:hypothetical protein